MQQDPQQPGVIVPGEEPRRPRRYRSLFWAIVLIAVGVVWLLFSAEVLSQANARMLTLLWPILLVGLGADLLLGRRSLGLGALVGVVTVAAIVILMVLGPSLGWVESAELKTETLSVPVALATSALISIDSGPYSANVHALQPSDAADRALLAATVDYSGSLHFEAGGGAERVVTLEAQGGGWWLPWIDQAGARPWDVGLDPRVPLALTSHTSSGSTDLDLAELTLTSLDVEISSGDAVVKLPAGGDQAYPAALRLSSGDLEAQVAAGARMKMTVDLSSGDASVALGADFDGTIAFDGSSGEFTLQLAAGQAYRVEVRQVSSGDVKLPDGLVHVSEGDDGEGIWETDGYASAERKVLVTIELSSGSVTIRSAAS
jgi:hypothetical protein